MLITSNTTTDQRTVEIESLVFVAPRRVESITRNVNVTTVS